MSHFQLQNRPISMYSRGIVALVFWLALVGSGRAETPGPAPGALTTAAYHTQTAPLPGSPIANPMPGGILACNAWVTGVDIAGKFRPVFAVRSGFVDYAERGHTIWTKAPDTPLSVRIEFDTPILWRGKRITHAYYTHMSDLRFTQREGARDDRLHVEQGQLLGVSGIGNGMAHLHLGLLLDGKVEQDRWDTMLRPGEIAALLGARNGMRLPLVPELLYR